MIMNIAVKFLPQYMLNYFPKYFLNIDKLRTSQKQR